MIIQKIYLIILHKCQQAIAAPVIAMLANETRSRRDEIWNKVTEAAKKYSDDSGHVKFNNDCICIVGYH